MTSVRNGFLSCAEVAVAAFSMRPSMRAFLPIIVFPVAFRFPDGLSDVRLSVFCNSTRRSS